MDALLPTESPISALPAPNAVKMFPIFLNLIAVLSEEGRRELREGALEAQTSLNGFVQDAAQDILTLLAVHELNVSNLVV